MNTETMSRYETPEAKSRHDTTASSLVLAAMLACVLSGALVADLGAPLILAANTVAQPQASGEGRP
jgi:hypothetical protein